MTRSRRRARMPSATYEAARVNPWGQRAPKEVQAFAPLLPPGSDTKSVTLNDFLYITTGSSSGAQGTRKNHPDIFLLFFLAHLFGGGLLPVCTFHWLRAPGAVSLLQDGRRINNVFISGEFKSWSVWLFAWMSNLNVDIMFVGLKVKAKLTYLSNSSKQQFPPQPRLPMKIRKKFHKNLKKNRWNA